MGPKGVPGRPKSAPGAPKSAPRAPKSAPRAPPSNPRAPKTYPRDARGAPGGGTFSCISAFSFVFMHFSAFSAFFSVFQRFSPFFCVFRCFSAFFHGIQHVPRGRPRCSQRFFCIPSSSSVFISFSVFVYAFGRRYFQVIFENPVGGFFKKT